jgi:hypothetical protein
MEDKFWAQLLAPFFLLACLSVGYPITHYVRHKMKRGWLRSFLLTELDPKKAARTRKGSAD